MPHTASRGPRHKRFSHTAQDTFIALALVAVVGLTIILTVLLMPSEEYTQENGEESHAAALEIPQGYDANCITGPIPEEIFSKEFPQFNAEAFTYRLNCTPYWQDGLLQDLYIENPKGNFYNMRVDIALKDGPFIYRSGAITPNQYLQNVEIKAAPAPSTVKAVVTITIFKDLDFDQPAATFSDDIEILFLE